MGDLWKYRYPPNTSSTPSPKSTILIPMALIFLDMRYMGVLAYIVVTFYVSKLLTTSLTASLPSSMVYVYAWWIVPR